MDATNWIPYVVSVAGVLIAIGGSLSKREQPPAQRDTLAPLPNETAAALQKLAESNMRLAEATMSMAQSTKLLADQVLPRLSRLEDDAREQDAMVRGIDRTVVGIAVRLKVKLEDADGRTRGSG